MIVVRNYNIKKFNEMKIVVLGKTGMLGRYVYTYFKSCGYDTIGVSRKDVDIGEVKRAVLAEYFTSLELGKGDVVINCMGVIKPRVDELGVLNAININSVFPHVLEAVLADMDVELIHPTTDCVFDGLEGQYDEDHPHNVTDIYGRTKSLGEPENSTVIRTSIIGDEVNQGRSLVEWIKSNKGGTVNGFTNHQWNGITCLEFAKICQQIIEKDLYWKGVRHVFSPTSVNKLELTTLISEIYGLGLTINPFETPTKCDRSMTTKYDDSGVIVKELKDQIIEMYNYFNILSAE